MERPGMFFQKGVEFQEKGLFDHAIEEYNRALALDPENLDILINLGAAYLQKGLAERSVQILTKVVEISPENHLALFNLGKAHLYREDPKRAVEIFERAARLLPDDLDVLKSLAESLLHLKRNSEAADLLRPHLDRMAGDFPGLLMAGRVFFGLERFPEALDAFRKAVTAVCDSAEALEGLVRCQLALDMKDKAMTTLKRGLMVEPGHPAFNVLMVDLLIDQQKIDESVELLKKALTLNPGDPVLRGKMDELVRRMPILKKRAEPGALVKKTSPFETEIYDVLDSLYDGKISLDDAENALLSLRKKDPADLFIAAELANFFFQTRRFDEAVSLYSQIYKSAPDLPEHRINLAKSLAMGGDVETAKDFLGESIRDLPSVSDFTLALVEIRLLEKDFAGAFQTLNQAAIDTSEHPHALFLEGYLCMRLGDYDKAEKVLRSLLLVAPQDEEAAVWFSRLAVLKDIPGEALKVWSGFRDGVESFVEIITRIELVMASGEKEAVKPLLHSIGDYKPRFLEDHLLFGKAFFYAGEFAEALREFETVLKHDPNHPEALACAAMVFLFRNKSAKFWMFWHRAIESDSLYPVLLGLVLRKALNFAQTERLRTETRRIHDITVLGNADRARLQYLLKVL